MHVLLYVWILKKYNACIININAAIYTAVVDYCYLHIIAVH